MSQRRGNLVLDFHQRVGKLVELSRQCVVCLIVLNRRCRQRLRSCPQEIGRKDVELGRLIDRLDGVTAKEAVAPGDQVVEILHDHGLLIGSGAQSRDQMGVKRVFPPLRHLLFQRGVTRIEFKQ